MQLWDAGFLFMPTILDAILIFDFFLTMQDAVFELAWSEDSKDNKISELFVSHTCILLILAIFSAICRSF